MGANAAFSSIGLTAGALVLAACSSPPPAATPPPAKEEPAKAKVETPQDLPKEPVDSGKECAKATAQCGGGVCSLTLDNTCAEAVTCDIAILTVCQAQTDLVQAKARRRETFAAGSKEAFSIPADCSNDRVVSTKVQSLACK